MADGDKGGDTQTTTDDKGGGGEGVQLPEDLKPEQLQELLKHPELTSEIDRRVTQAVETTTKRL